MPPSEIDPDQKYFYMVRKFSAEIGIIIFELSNNFLLNSVIITVDYFSVSEFCESELPTQILVGSIQGNLIDTMKQLVKDVKFHVGLLNQ